MTAETCALRDTVRSSGPSMADDHQRFARNRSGATNSWMRSIVHSNVVFTSPGLVQLRETVNLSLYIITAVIP
jgi:hypothetical protein